MNNEGVFVLITLFGIFLFLLRRNKKTKWKNPTSNFPDKWRRILIKEVNFYISLSAKKKKLFEFKIHEFTENCIITGVETSVSDLDKVLIASSAIIPIFNFPDWKYSNISEVLLYPTSFNEKFETNGSDRNILGMVGTGYMEGKMILSKQALHHGFKNETDKKNTAIHEFVHLIDKTDGTIDGIPSLLLEKQYTIPWIELIHKKIDDIYNNSSDINPYGATNKAEFFAVISEYFFERPKLLKINHPEIYKNLELIFKQKMADKNLLKTSHEINRNDPCPCGSKLKYKKCCGKE
ncbi:MAG: zinc-dependent peptidase [Salinivirgaceae bacterium]|nr:zinc-dependent peptidase [Salinivirgaceae bacterium]